jgi:hypothetical protein
MPERNTPQKSIESWKQIAAYLDRSERTVRRWEASEGLPVHRRGHQRYDTVFAYKHEIEAWARGRTRFGGQDTTRVGPKGRDPLPTELPANQYLVEHDAITRTMDDMWPVLALATETSCAQRSIGKRRSLAIVRA